MGRIAYTVTATLPDKATREEYTRWLLEGHLQQVLAGGASHADVVILDDPPSPPQAQSRYIFPTRASFDRYVRECAPALRAEGLSRFPPSLGITFRREVGTILEPVGNVQDPTHP